MSAGEEQDMKVRVRIVRDNGEMIIILKLENLRIGHGNDLDRWGLKYICKKPVHIK